MKRLLVLSLAAVVALPLFAASAVIPETQAVARAAAYLQAHQKPDGSYTSGGFGQNDDVIFALRSAGFDPSKDVTAGKSSVDYFTANAAAETKPADAAKAALAAKALGLDPKSVGGANLIANVTAGYDSTKGTYAADDFSQSIAMLGLACTGNTVPAQASAALKANQIADGGWGFQGASDPDTTAIAVQALLASGAAQNDPAIAKAIAWFGKNQLADGGWGTAPSSNVDSTAYVVQALLADGLSPDSGAYVHGTVSPTTFLLSQQNADGSFMGYDAGIATAQSIPALAGRTFCNAADTAITQVRQQPTATPTATATTPAPAIPTAAVTPAGPTPSTTPPGATPVKTPSTTAPAAPNTGSGTRATREPWTAGGVVLVLAAMAAVLGWVAFRRGS